MDIPYPSILRRYIATLVDIAVILILIAVVISHFQAETNEAVLWRIGLVALIVFVYEPTLTSFACTAGQKIIGIRVRKSSDQTQKLFLVQAWVRSFFKWFFGWYSFIAIFFSDRKRALHDMMSGSVVVDVKQLS